MKKIEWNKALEITKQTSQYYVLVKRSLGKQMADYFWEKKYHPENVNYLDYKECREIIKKCDKFLEKKGIKPWGGY